MCDTGTFEGSTVENEDGEAARISSLEVGRMEGWLESVKNCRRAKKYQKKWSQVWDDWKATALRL